MRTRSLSSFLLLCCLSLALLGCDVIPEEGTIVYDVDFPRADSDEAQGGSGGGSGSSNGSTPSGLNTSASVSVTTINEGATDTESFVLAGPPNGTVTITFSSGDTSEATLSPATMSFDNSTWYIPQTLTITAPEDYSVDGNQTTAISYTIASTDPTDTLHGAAGNFNVVTADSGATAVTVANNSPSLTEGTTDNNTTFQLSGPPNGTVTVTITSSDTGEATVSPTTLTFDNTTWNVPQTITLTGVEDYLIDGNQSSTISYTLSSTDTTEPFHNAFGSYTASIVDSGTRLFVVSDDSPTVNEGYSSTITFALDSAPTGTVTVNLSSADDNETTVSPTTLTFNSGNYNVAQTITLYGPEDYIIDGNQQTVVNFAVTSTDPTDVVHNVNTSITATTVDSGLGTAFSLSNNSPSTTEGTTDNSTTFVLLSPPKGTVTVTFSSADDNETVVSPNTLTFTPANWNVPQALPLVGVEDFIADNNTTTAMNVSFSSTDPTDGVHGESGSFNVITNDSGITGTFTLSPSTPSVAEGSSDNSSTFVLTSPPNGTVTVTLTSDNSSELGVSPTNLVFTPANWNVPQNFTVTGVEDFNVDNNQSTNINISYSSSDTTDGIHGQSSSFAVNVTDSGLGATTLDNATAGVQENTIYWSAPTGLSGFTIYYTSNGSPPTTSSDNISISDGTQTSYVHGGLTANTTYTYSIVAQLGSVSSGLSSTVTGRPTAFSCTPSYNADTDPDLLAYYDFQGDLNDSSPANGRTASASAWPYHLSNSGGTIRFPAGCSDGLAGYFDSSSGYAHNDNLNDNTTGNLFASGNFTISFWFRADADTPNSNYASFMSSRYVPDTGDDSNIWSWQLDVDSYRKIRWRAGRGNANGDREVITSNPNFQYSADDWTQATYVKHDNDTVEIYVDGDLKKTGDQADTPLYALKIGTNRREAWHWKGYIDEFKVYGRALTQNEVVDKCLAYSECSNRAPAIPDNLTVGLGSTDQQLSISWNATNGTDNYTIYWVDNSTATGLIDPDNASTYDNFTVVTGTSVTAYNLTPGQTYNFTVVANNSTGSSAAATEASGAPAAAFTLSPSNVTVVEGTDNTTGFALIQQPNGNVTVTFTSADTSEVTISPTTLLFTGGPSGNYSSSQTITLTGVQDYLPSDGDKPITINLSFDSTDNSDEVEGLSSSFTVTSIDSNVGLSAPGGLSAVVPTTIAGQVNLSWSGSSENIDNYTIYWTDNTSLTIDPDNASTYLGSYTTTSTSPTSYSVTNLTNSLQHGFTLVANNSGGRSPVATPDNATPLVPTPSGLSTTVGMGTGQVDLTWSAVSGADNYTIYISTDNITFNPLSPAVTGTSYSSTTLDNGTALSVGSSYSYYIVANGGGGSSANSTIVSATPVVANVVRSANGLRFNDVELYPDGSAVATGEWVQGYTGFTTNAPYSLGNLTVSNRGFMVAKTENGDWSWVWQPDQGHRGNYNAYVYRGFLVSELAALPDGSVLMAGRAQGGSGGFKANDKSGNTITYPCIDDGDGAQDLCATNAFVGKLDKDGKLLWASSVAAGTAASGLTGNNGAYMHYSAHSAVEAIALAPDGGSFVLGWLQHYTDLVFPTATDNVTLSFANYSLSDNNKAAFLGKLDSAGNWVWVKLISGNTHIVNSVKSKSTQNLSGDGYAIETGPGPNLLDVSPDGSVVIAIGSRRPSSCNPGCTDNYTVIFGDPSLGDNFTFTEHHYKSNAHDKIIIAKFLDNGSFAWGHDTGVYYQSGTSYSGVHVHALRDNSTLLVNYRDDNVTIESKVSLKKLAGDGTVVENQEPNFYLASQQKCSSGGFNNAVKIDQGRMEYNGNPAGPLTCHSMAVTPDESAIWLMCEGAWNYRMGMFKFDISSNFGTRLSGRNITSQPSNSSAHWGDFSSVLPDGNAAALISIYAWANGSTPLPRSFTIDSYDSSGCKVAEQTYQNTEDFSRESFLLRFNTNDNGSWTNWSPVVNTPSVPQNLTATQGAAGEIQLNWDAVSRNELASYEIYRRDLGGSSTSPTVVDLTDNKISVSPSNHLDSSLTSGSYFNYAVRAVNLSDNSSLSSPVGNVQAP